MDRRVFNRELVLISYLRGLQKHAILGNNSQGGLQEMKEKLLGIMVLYLTVE